MASSADPASLAAQARRVYAEQLVKGLAAVVNTLAEAANQLLNEPAEHQRFLRRRELVQELKTGAATWHRAMVGSLRAGLLHDLSAQRSGDLPRPGSAATKLSLVDDDTIEREILTSRLGLAMMDRAASEFSDLRARMAVLERREELEAADLLRAHALARIVVDGWRAAGCSLDSWRELQLPLHAEFAALVEEAYHEANRWLLAQGVLAEVDLHPFIRRSRELPQAGTAPGSGGFGPSTSGAGGGHAGGPAGVGGGSHPGPGAWAAGGTAGAGSYPAAGRADGGAGRGGGGGAGGGGAGGGRAAAGSGVVGSAGVHGGATGGPAGAAGWGGGRDGGGHEHAHPGSPGDETRLMTRGAALAPAGAAGQQLLGQLNQLVGRQVQGFAQTTRSQRLSPKLAQAIEQVQQRQQRPSAGSTRRADAMGPTPALLEELQQRKQALKQAAATPEERATIEIVAMMFQSILTEERIPAGVRVWFARLQMPVLRVAVTEPDFFATVDHPARRLIDRMGACVLGFDSSTPTVGDALDKEIKRVVQVVEAYPDTGRRVFQTVLTEFERFLEHYFSTENEATRRGVSLAQQVEQRETLAIQYTIELRRMLAEVPVQDSVRAFLFQVWADVLATTALRFGAQGEEIRGAKRAAADLIWSASAKVTRDERAEVIRRLTPLLKTLREGMATTGMDPAVQDEHLQVLNNSLAAAFTAKAPVIPGDRLQELAERLESLEELLPEAAEVALDDAIVRDLSGHESSELEVVAQGGSMPTPAMLAWARELQVGGWYMLDYRGRNEPVQLAWLGLQKKLSMFVTPQGRCVLFQQHRLASFLQAGLLLPAQDESLSVRATRSALVKLDVDPARLLA